MTRRGYERTRIGRSGGRATAIERGGDALRVQARLDLTQECDGQPQRDQRGGRIVRSHRHAQHGADGTGAFVMPIVIAVPGGHPLPVADGRGVMVVFQMMQEVERPRAGCGECEQKQDGRASEHNRSMCKSIAKVNSTSRNGCGASSRPWRWSTGVRRSSDLKQPSHWTPRIAWRMLHPMRNTRRSTSTARRSINAKRPEYWPVAR